jgi:hypothetical protein
MSKRVAIIKPSSESGLFDWKLLRLAPMGGPTLNNTNKKFK